MLQSMGSQRAGNDLGTKQHNKYMLHNKITFSVLYNNIYGQLDRSISI